MAYVLPLRKALAGLAVILLTNGCDPFGGLLSGSWNMDNTLDPSDLLERVTDELKPLGYAYTKGQKHVDYENYCMWYQEWSEHKSRRHGDYGGNNVSVTIPCDENRVEIRHRVWGTHWSGEQLDHYYFLRNELFPQIMGRTAEALNVETRSHPGKAIRIEDLEQFDREPLNASLQERLAKWQAGEWPSTQEKHLRTIGRWARRFAVGYGIPMAIGSVIFWGIWRFIRKKSLSIKAQRFWFVTLGIFVFTPAPIPLMGLTTLGVTLVTGLLFVLLPMYPIDYPLYLLGPLIIGFVFWRLAVWLVPS